ncbi:MAG: ABC transporter substrate-binding protein [Clostridiales bacterium]|nr:ABC transporter substrate-binding protein [Roseburia sp.]MDD7638459.1 ABC transporter substrate-binding protein [Clostridiales bacterium]MDY4112993.1 ABC transporter substrate-binding protein [Roseburia sp.]
MKKKLISLLLVASMVASLAACGGDKGETVDSTESGSNTATTSTYDTLVVGLQPMDGVFSPFFYTSAYDDQVNTAVFENVCELNADGELVDNAGHVEVEEVTAEDGSTKYVYTVSVQEGMTFSDGEPVTIDDLLFSYYVYADPTYDGMSTFGTLDIEGMEEYRNSAAPLWKAMVNAGEENTDFSNWTEEQQTAFFGTDLPTAGAAFAQEIVDYCVEAGYAADSNDVATAAAAWGFDGLAEDATAEDFFYLMADGYGWDLLSLSNTESAGSSLFDLLGDGYTEVVELADVDSISGIQKVDDYTCTVTFNSANISADKQVAWLPLIPEHYYGESFTKGDLSGVKAKNSAPMGSGPYVFQSYENNIVTLTANESYWKGCPKIPNLKFQVVNEQDKVDLVLNGEIDITDPSASLEIVDQLDQNTDKAAYSLVDNPGYGYIGINAERVPDVNVRKGLMCLMNREPAVQSYYGELGTVIERPMTPTLAEYPDDAEPYYSYDPAKALEYFEAAGYTQKDGKLVNADGEQLKVTCGIGDASSHPSTPILTQMANDLASMGGELVVNDLEFNVLSTQVQGGELDMWVMAWGNSTDCDLTQIFGSEGGSNYQHYYSPEIDALQAEILQTVDFDKRCELVAEELDLIMDAAVYMPVYQRKNMEIYNAATLNISTLPEETTTYYNYSKQYETLEMN